MSALYRIAVQIANCFSGYTTSSAPFLSKNFACTSLAALDTTNLAPNSFKSEVVSKELWKLSPIATIHTSKIANSQGFHGAFLIHGTVISSDIVGKLIRYIILLKAMQEALNLVM